MAIFMRRFGAIGLTFAVIAFLTRAYYLGDTLTYTNDILAFDRGFSDVPVGPLWEFGHLVWRPLGFVVYKFLWAVLPASLGLDERLVCTAGLITVSLFCGWLAVSLFYSLATQFTRSALVGYLIAVSLMCTNAFLNHMHAGHAYVPAVAFLTLGIWLLVRRATILFACAAGAALALSALLWFPFVLVIPAGLLVGLLGTDALGHKRARFVVVAALSCACVGLLGYAIGAFEVHATSIPLFKDWFLNSRHGIHQSNNLLRTLFGIPRAFVFVSDDGVMYKRYLLHDPYANVAFSDLLRFTLVKIGMFYLVVIALLYSLAQGRFSRRMLICLLAAAIPILVFAIFLFEGGSMERYLPLFPFICLAFSAFFSGPPRHVLATSIVVLFAGLAIVSNLYATSYRRVAADAEARAIRVRPLKTVFRAHSEVALISYQDSLFVFALNFPFHPVNRPVPLIMFPIVETSVNSATWMEEFSSKTISIWERAGDLWVTKRAFAERPAPAWDWVEGDNPNLSWQQISRFFRNLEVADSVGGADGFVRILPSDHNRLFLHLPAVPKTLALDGGYDSVSSMQN